MESPKTEMKMIRNIIMAIAAIVVMCGCTFTPNEEQFQTQVFTVQEYVGAERQVVTEVKYCVNGDTLFTSEKYHFISLIYADDATDSLAYMHMVVFDRSQQPNADGWYHLTFADVNVPRISQTHLSGFVLRNYDGSEYHKEFYRGTPDAYLFNTTVNVTPAPTKHYLDPELKKLYPYIK